MSQDGRTRAAYIRFIESTGEKKFNELLKSTLVEVEDVTREWLNKGLMPVERLL